MALVVKDRVKETTATTGSTDAYNLAGAVTGFQTFNAVLSNGDTTYYCCTDGTDFEVGIGTFASSGTTLARTTILESSNSNNAVNWSSGTRDIFITQPAEKAVFLNADGDIEFDNSHRIKLTSNSSDPALAIAGGGPNFIRFHDGSDFTDATNAVDIIYRTTPNDLLIERGGNDIASFGGDDGHAALYYNNSKKLETVSGGVDITGNITVSGTVDGRDLATDGTKLDGIEASADVTDTTNVTAAGALMDSEVTNLAQVKAFDSSDYATAAQGTTADAAMPKAGGTFTGDVTFTGDNYNIVFDKSDDALEFADNAKAVFGAGGDLQIYHSGSGSFISDAGTGNLRIGGSAVTIENSSFNETMMLATQNGAVELYHDNSKKLETTADGVSVSSTDAGASAAPSLEVYRNSASPATNDDLGEITFDGNDDAGQKIEYARIDARTVDVSSSNPDGQLDIAVTRNGVSTVYQRMGFSLAQFYQSIYLGTNLVIRFEGSTYNDFETDLTVANPTADRTITLPDATGTVQLTDGSGASLTSLNASELGSGTVPNARLDQQLQDVAGLAVTNGNFIVGDGSNFVAESGATARTSLGLGSIATQAADSVNIDGGAIDGVTIGTNSAVTDLRVDNLKFDSATISSTNTNGGIGISPNGTGDVFLNCDRVFVGDGNANAAITSNGTGDLTLETNSGTNSGSIVIADGVNGNISITPNGTGSVVIDGLNYPQADGSNGQVLTTNGSGTLSFSTITSGVSNDDATALAIALG